MPGQLVFGRDMILNTQYLADWTAIKARKQQLIRKNKLIKNPKRIPHQYKVGNMVMLGGVITESNAQLGRMAPPLGIGHNP